MATIEARVTVLEHQMVERIGRLDREERLAEQRDQEFAAINTLLDEHSKMHLSHREALIALRGDVRALDGKVAALDGKVTALDGKVRALDGKVAALDGSVAALDGRVASLEREVSGLRTEMRSGFTLLQQAMEGLTVKLDRLSPE